MRARKFARSCGRLVAATMYCVLFFTFMLFSLVITAKGTARFSVAMGFGPEVGWVAGAAFEFGKEVLLLALLRLWSKRSWLLFAVLSVAWLGLVTYSCLATEATVSAAIAEVERTATRDMESRSGIQAHLASLQQQIARLAQPTIPRPSKTVREALAAEKVPAGIWRNSQECLNIRGDTYFQKACAGVLGLRQELAAAEDYERLTDTARALAEVLAKTPIVATSDPLTEAFDATLGRWLPLNGRAGVALLLTIVIEIMSTLGPTAMKLLWETGSDNPTEDQARALSPPDKTFSPWSAWLWGKKLPPAKSREVPGPSPSFHNHKGNGADGSGRVQASPNGFAIPPASSREGRVSPGEVAERDTQRGSPLAPEMSLAISHVAAFDRECLEVAPGMPVWASDLRASYETWCQAHGYKPLSPQKFGTELKRLGYEKWKTGWLVKSSFVQCNIIMLHCTP